MRLWFYCSSLLEDTKVHETLYKHSHRASTWRMWGLALFSMYLGSLLFYVNYKVNVVEPKWVQDYGQDVPVFKKFKFISDVQYFRAKYIHFYKYRLFFYVEEQVIDPLNDNSLAPKAFDVY